MISRCRTNCKNAGQDQLHGDGFRVLNFVPAKDKMNDTFRCTVCGTVHTPSQVKGK